MKFSDWVVVIIYGVFFVMISGIIIPLYLGFNASQIFTYSMLIWFGLCIVLVLLEHFGIIGKRVYDKNDKEETEEEIEEEK